MKPNKQMISLSIDRELYIKTKTTAIKKGMNHSEFYEFMIKEFFKNYKD